MSNKLPIDKGIPLPEESTRGRDSKYPFPNMQVGDSFLADSRNIGITAKQWATRNKSDMQFVTRAEGDKTRIWRKK